MKKMFGNWVGERRLFNLGEGYVFLKFLFMNVNGKFFEEKGWYKGYLYIYVCGKIFIIIFLKLCLLYLIKEIIF